MYNVWFFSFKNLSDQLRNHISMTFAPHSVRASVDRSLYVICRSMNFSCAYAEQKVLKKSSVYIYIYINVTNWYYWFIFIKRYPIIFIFRSIILQRTIDFTQKKKRIITWVRWEIRMVESNRLLFAYVQTEIYLIRLNEFLMRVYYFSHAISMRELMFVAYGNHHII